MIKELEKEFEGIGEVAGFKFKQINISSTSYLYEVSNGGMNIHYEVFKRKNAPICIDFEKRIYSDIDFKDQYPKSNKFGIWAWCIKDYNKALIKFNEL